MDTGCLGGRPGKSHESSSHHLLWFGSVTVYMLGVCVHVCTLISLLSFFFPYFLSPSHTCIFFLLSLPMFCVFNYSVSDQPLSVFLSQHRCCLWVQMCCRSTSCRLLASTSGRCCTTAPSRRCGTGSSCCWSSTPPS